MRADTIIFGTLKAALICFAVFGLVGCDSNDDDSGSGPRDAASDGPHDSATGEDAWSGCRGAQGTPLSCASVGARVLAGSRYDRERQCFMPAERIDEVCAVPTYCPGGGGGLACLVSPAGGPFVAFVLYGEELSDPAWHHDSGAGLETTVTEAEARLCEELRRALQPMEGDEDAGSVPLDFLNGTQAKVSPACAIADE
jgi:hypothetical protein